MDAVHARFSSSSEPERHVYHRWSRGPGLFGYRGGRSVGRPDSFVDAARSTALVRSSVRLPRFVRSGGLAGVCVRDVDGTAPCGHGSVGRECRCEGGFRGVHLAGCSLKGLGDFATGRVCGVLQYRVECGLQ
jgi:hypothetical protein